MSQKKEQKGQSPKIDNQNGQQSLKKRTQNGQNPKKKNQKRQHNPKKKSQKGSTNLITMTKPKSSTSEQYRTIRTNIEFSIVDTTLTTLSCTSAIPEEGKTTTISNLAVTIAQQGQKVLLVDADLRKPTIHQIIGLKKNQFGLTSLITKTAKPDQAISKSPEIPNLSILPSGPIPPNPSELLSSNKMEELISDFSEKYDMVLFDTPPILAVTDAQILSSHCDGVVLVIRSRRTEKKDLIKAKELLDRTKCNILGTIFNDVDQKDAYYYYERAE